MVFCEEIELKVSKRVNIIGSAPGWQEVPEDDGYIWGVNNTHFNRDVDLVIDIHSSRKKPKEDKDRAHVKILEWKNVPTYMVDEVCDKPHIMKYPLKEILEEFGEDYFGSGIDYMIALAIYMGAEEIHLYGVWMKGDSEYSHQKPSCEFWLGVCNGRGIKYKVHGDGTTLLKTRNGLMYGFQKPQRWVYEQDHHNAEMLEWISENSYYN